LTLVMWLASLEAEHADHRRRELAARREALTAQCLAALGSRPQLQKRFWALLQVAQRHAVLREHQAASSPLAGRCCAAARCASASCSTPTG
jgi:hypothetical protein